MGKKKTASTAAHQSSPQELLIGYIDVALGCAKTASRHNQSLNGANFYANKMADLRADATIAFERLRGGSVGDTSALAELIQKVFSVNASAKDRTQAARDLQFSLKTTWAETKPDKGKLEDNGVFPLSR
jgi:hypothetical protein